MIITSIPRSGSTKYGMDMAAHADLTYVDEIFELGMTTAHKVIIHTTTDIHPQLKTAAHISSLDFNKCVINNHEINWFLLENTDIFLSRKNVQDTVWSYVAYMSEYHRVIHNLDTMVSDIIMHTHLTRLKSRIQLFYEYCVVKDKPIVIPELEFTDQSIYRTKYSKWTPLILDMADNLILPKMLEFT